MSDPYAFLSRDDEMGRQIRTRDWSQTPLGSVAGWPGALKVALATMSSSPQAMFLAWGPELIAFFNDPYRPILGARLDGALGQPFEALWGDIWSDIAPIVEAALAGEGSSFENLPLTMTRNGAPEETWWSFTYMPLRDETGSVRGLLCTTLETTRQVLAERHARGERRRLSRLFEQAPSFMAMLEGPDHTVVLTNPGYQRLIGHREVVGKPMAEALPEAVAQGFVALLDGVYTTGRTYRSTSAKYAMQTTAGGASDERVVDFVYQPVTDEAGTVTGIFIEGIDVTEAHVAQVALRESEAFTRRVLESSTDCIKVLSLDGSLEFMSVGGMGVMEVDDFCTVQGACWPDFWMGEEHAKALDAVACARSGGTGRFRGFSPTAKGRMRYWDVIVTPINDPSGEPEKLLSISRDITDQQAAEAALSEREARLRLVIEGAQDHAIFTTDAAGVITGWSAGAVSIFGWSTEEAVGRSCTLTFTPEDRAADAPATELLTAVREGCANDERWHIAKDGRRVFMNGSVHPLPADASGAAGFIKIARDETVRRQQDEALRRLNETLEQQVGERTKERNLLASIVETTDAFIQVVDLEYRLLAVNKASADEFERVFGLRPQVGDHLLDLLADAPEHRESVRALWSRALAGEEFTVVEPFGDAARDRPYYEIKFNTLRDERGERIGAYQFVYDVTERLRREARFAEAEEQLRQSQKLEAVGQLTGGVAHDFNNLLTVINGSIELLRRPDVAEPRRERYLEAISTAADRATRLTSQLLAFSRRQTLRPERFDVGRSVVSITDMIGTLTGSRIDVALSLNDVALFVDADRAQLDAALVNMAVNARDAMNGEGRLTIDIRPVDGMPSIRSQPPLVGRFVSIAVGDTGSGIPAEQLEQIFEPFFTTKPVGQGTGLGLSQVIGFAKQSGGEVQVVSTPDAGTTFTLFLPRAAAETAVEVAAALAEPMADGAGARVLVVEDNPDVGAFVLQTLGELGYETVLAADGRAALTVLERDPGQFSVVFSDVVMPEMGGVDLARRVRELYPALQIVLTSGYSHVLAQHGTFGFELLHKPYTMEQLSRALQRAAVAPAPGPTLS